MLKSFVNFFKNILGPDLFSIVIKFIKFGTVGVSGVVINLTIFNLSFIQFGLSLNISSIVAFLVASMNNYIWGHFWAFASDNFSSQVSYKSYFKYISFSTLGLAINLIVLNAVVASTGEDAYLVAQLLGIVTAAFFNFIVFSLFVFKDEKSS
mgnify:CR=1 FL=1|jgi:dolichol-phosphate mannosyltransferase|tara:strand:+ start:1711 stop:2166 length:456 start_codon:yes stop_codon:yes gene_type:complete